jgi:hypothetical protein
MVMTWPWRVTILLLLSRLEFPPTGELARPQLLSLPLGTPAWPDGPRAASRTLASEAVVQTFRGPTNMHRSTDGERRTCTPRL